MVKNEIGWLVKARDLQVGDYFAYRAGKTVYRVVCIDGDNVVVIAMYYSPNGKQLSIAGYESIRIDYSGDLVIMEDCLTRQIKDEEIRRANLPNEVKEWFAKRAISNRVGSRVKVRDVRVGEYIKFDSIRSSYYHVISEIQQNTSECVEGIDYCTGRTFNAMLGLTFSGDRIITIVNEKGKVD